MYALDVDANLVRAADKMRDAIRQDVKFRNRDTQVTVTMTAGTYNLIDYLLRKIADAQPLPQEA